jgi:2-succinyl-6-hydroxy-2,4-cyclohexadiene-1-carboxylate synthase
MISRFCLHGFLGRPSDFGFLSQTHVALDYLSVSDLSPMQCDLQSWGEAFWKHLESQTLINQNADPIELVGYSLGGRLALSAFAARPEKVSKLILLSTQFYFPKDEVASRKIWDQQWANRFLSEPFTSVVTDWNRLPIFNGSRSEPERIEQDYSKKVLAKILTDWSPAIQPDYTQTLIDAKVPVLNLIGQHDDRYQKLSKRLQGSAIQTRTIKDSGHRIWCDQPVEVNQQILTG